jgi:hypothetical protein
VGDAFASLIAVEPLELAEQVERVRWFKSDRHGLVSSKWAREPVVERGELRRLHQR